MNPTTLILPVDTQEDLPTLIELLHETVRRLEIGAPAKTSPETIAKLNASVDKFIKTEEGTARLRKLGADPVGGSPADMQRFVLAETEKWGKVAKFAKIEPQ